MPLGDFFNNIKNSLGFGGNEEKKQTKTNTTPKNAFNEESSSFDITKKDTDITKQEQEAKQSLPEKEIQRRRVEEERNQSVPQNEVESILSDVEEDTQKKEKNQQSEVQSLLSDVDTTEDVSKEEANLFGGEPFEIQTEQEGTAPKREEAEPSGLEFKQQADKVFEEPIQEDTGAVPKREPDQQPEIEGDKDTGKKSVSEILNVDDYDKTPLGRLQKGAQGKGLSKVANLGAGILEFGERITEEAVKDPLDTIVNKTAPEIEQQTKEKAKKASKDVPLNVGAENIRNWAKNRIEENEEFQTDEKFKERGGLNNFQGIVNNLKEDPVDTVATITGEEAPMMLSLMLGGNYALAGMGMAGAEETTREAIKQGDSKVEATLKGTTRGAFEGVAEKIGLDRLLGRGNTRKLTKSFTENLWRTAKDEAPRIGTEVGTEGAQEIVANAIATTYDESQEIFNDQVLTAMTRATAPAAAVRTGAAAARLNETQEETQTRQQQEEAPIFGARLPIGLTTKEEGEPQAPEGETTLESDANFTENQRKQLQEDIINIAQNENLDLKQKAEEVENITNQSQLSGQNIQQEIENISQRNDVSSDVTNQLKQIQEQVSEIRRGQQRQEFNQEQSREVINKKQTQNVLRKDTEDISSEELVNLKDTRKEIVDNFLDSRQGAALETELEQNRQLIERELNEKVASGIKNNPRRMAGDRLPDRAGQGLLMSKKTKAGNNRYVVVGPKNIDRYRNELGYEKIMEIDSLAQEAGFERGENYLQRQQELDQLPVKSTRAVAEDRLYEQDSNFKEVMDKLTAAKRQMRGETVTKEKFETRKGRETRGQNRRKKIRAIQDYFGLNDYQMNQINQRDVRNMGKAEFTNYLKKIERKAIQYKDKLQAKNELMSLIERKEFIKWNNIRRLENFPPVSKMDENQLRAFQNVLEQFNKGDEFLSTRKMETVDNTDLEGVRTYREARNKISEQMGIDKENLEDLPTGSAKDYVFSWDQALSQKYDVYDSLVQEFYKIMGEKDVKIAELRQEVNDLAKKARNSRNQTLGETVSDLISPTDELIVQYLEGDQQTKEQAKAEMTKEEMDLAHYIQTDFAQDRDYLIKKEEMEEGRDNYYTHVKRPFLEAAMDDGTLSSLKELLYADEGEVNMKLREGDSGEIVPLEKFFKFSVRRTGEIEPTKNVVKSYMTYKRSIERKKALDKLLPKIELYKKIILGSEKADTEAKEARKKQQRKFLNQWLNHKRGERMNKWIDPYGKGAQIIDMWDKYVSFKTLALQMPVQVTAGIGEKSMNWIQQGARKNIKGAKRKVQNPKKAKRIADKYEEIVGQGVMQQLQDQAENAGQKTLSILYGGFSQARRGTNLNFLLSEMTEKEYQNEELPPEKLADIRKRLGRFRPQSYVQSIFESSPEGELVLKFTDWATRAGNGIYNSLKGAMEAIDTNFDTESFNNKIRNGQVGAALKEMSDAIKRADDADKRRVAQSMRFAGLGAVLVSISALASEEALEWNKDETLWQEFFRKGVRELGTAFQSLNPVTYIGLLGMNVTELFDVIENLSKLNETYEDRKKGVPFNSKGIRGLYNDLTPKTIKQILEKTFPQNRQTLIERKLEMLGEEGETIKTEDKEIQGLLKETENIEESNLKNNNEAKITENEVESLLNEIE